jgi:mRNA interferase MazF
MEKDFDSWNIQKKNIEQSTQKFFFKEGEIWWSSVGLNVRNESCGKGETFRRPVLVIKKLSTDMCIGIPLTSKNKTGSWFETITLNNESKVALVYQVRMFSTNRFQRRLATLDDNDFKKVKEKLKTLLELS